MKRLVGSNFPHFKARISRTFPYSYHYSMPSAIIVHAVALLLELELVERLLSTLQLTKYILVQRNSLLVLPDRLLAQRKLLLQPLHLSFLAEDHVREHMKDRVLLVEFASSSTSGLARHLAKDLVYIAVSAAITRYRSKRTRHLPAKDGPESTSSAF